MNSDLFLDYMERFQSFTKCSAQNPILLILDNHVSHRSLEVLKFCRANGIHMLSFPPHTSHRLQPLDVSVFRPFKLSANQLCEDWVTEHPGRVMQIYDLPPIFDRALKYGATEINIQSGFRATGLVPYDRQVFQDIDFLPNTSFDRPEESMNAGNIPMGMDEQESIEENDVDDMDVDDGGNMVPLSTSTPRGSTQDLRQSLEDIRPFPQAPPRATGKRRGPKPQKSAILTSDQTINEIQAVQDERDAKKKAVEDRKVAAAAKRAVTALKKQQAAENKASKKKSGLMPRRVTKRRQTTAVDYAEPSRHEDDDIEFFD